MNHTQVNHPQVNVRKQTKFRNYCDEKGYTKEYVAEAIGLKPRAVYAYFIGERVPSRKVLKKMQDVFDIDPNELFPL